MLISWNWLKDYVAVDVPPEEMVRRWMLAGLNHEETTPIDGDLAIDLEITSNRPDCLGHIGVAREAAVLLGRELKKPAAQPHEGTTAVDALTSVRIDCPQLCPRYTARVIRGVRVRPSPDWLVRRLKTIGAGAINNVVDVTNYVLFECGQPLHAFDLAKLHERRIIVREAKPNEEFLAINHKTYRLVPGTCVIADADRAVALGGVMGGAETEVTAQTTDLLIESAQFDPLAIRNAARLLNLHSDSSYRFERELDPAGVDWASRRCCELILDLGGGELASGVIDVGAQAKARSPIVLRWSQLPRVLGIEIPRERVRQILTALGNRELRCDAERIEVIPPTWRSDLTREIDLIEEAARIHGYDAIPEDVRVPMAPSQRSADDRVFARVRSVLSSAGFDEALTLSAVDPDWESLDHSMAQTAVLRCQTPILRRADTLRRTLVPSLLAARRTNESLSNPRIELFEIAKVYFPRDGGLPDEPWILGLTSGGDFSFVKGLLEALVSALNPEVSLEVQASEWLGARPAAELRLRGQLLGRVAELGTVKHLVKQFELRSATTVAEIRLLPLVESARGVARAAELSPYPAIARDINLVVAESVRWADVETAARASAGPHLERLHYLDTYRDRERIGSGKKSFLMSLVLRSRTGTLTGEEADAARDAVVAACGARYGAVLRA